MKFFSYNLNTTDKISSFPALLEVIVDKGNITLHFKGHITFKVHDIYPFRVLNKVREKLEEDNLFLTCKGSRIDVHYTGATLVGFKAYKIKKGEPLKLKNMVNIFESEPDLEALSTITDQNRYFNNWLESVRVE